MSNRLDNPENCREVQAGFGFVWDIIKIAKERKHEPHKETKARSFMRGNIQQRPNKAFG